jgi:aflatoxin B1 aldehyde reductase
MKIVFGTMVFGGRVTDPVQIERMLTTFVRLTGQQSGAAALLDTALIYPMNPACEGLTEQLLAKHLHNVPTTVPIVLHSKINPWCADSFSAAGVVSQMDRILSNLQRDSLELLYLHAPDHSVPIGVTLEAVDRLHRQGKVRHFGLSNYSAWQVADIVRTCEQRGWLRPTVYQGLYNGISRDVERELFPCLRHFDIPFYAYNATAGGLLTGKHRLEQVPTEGRFTSPVYLKRYWNDKYFGALTRLQEACAAEQIAVADAAHRWLAHHSKLDVARGDAIIVGASSAEQLEQNIAACISAGPLPQSIVDAFDQANEVAKPVWPSYFR